MGCNAKSGTVLMYRKYNNSAFSGSFMLKEL